ncbi:DUF6578 domain-containing protein [Streptomyces sp. NPDC013455]|uniref:DUF6578 domain-containing protein n=1 Tax=Streptomyces sp. NPDC013455 TaxID=3155605 RepID=UPI0033F948BD
MARTRVFYEDWQLQCCGTPFAVGDEVAWRLVAVDGREPPDGHHGAAAWVENHGGPGRATTGRVRAIELVHQEHTVHPRPVPPVPDDVEPGTVVFRKPPYTLEAVPGAVTLESVDRCPRWFEEEEPDPGAGPGRVRRTRGALVTLDIPDVPNVPDVPDVPPAGAGERP